MPTIGNNQFPYPNTSDEPNIPGDLQKLALAVDTAIGGGNRLIDTLATLQAIPKTQLFEGMRATVTNDPTTMNNGEYVYTGGAWVHQTSRVFAGSVVLRNVGTYAGLLSGAQITQICGRAFNIDTDCIMAMNGDVSTSSAIITGTGWVPSQDQAVIWLSGPTPLIRVNYMIILGKS